ncbi:hypothetical protein QDY71_08910 [Kingella negevensis]|uniref:hypothetical protein n=1 Tax=Kingella negevensis TaxID=1522312 RepID=UPI002543D7B1|nr:hypothetical protein [Kingella negevensis]MDK4697862.1 hypothetical protein [Kingella negevensis]WII92760.1 hypothetical protein QEO94_08995 [Kingella negevensis]
MKTKILASVLVLAASQMAAAEIYSCGDGCYTSSPKKATGGKAKLGNKIGSYTSVMPERVSPTVTAEAASKAEPKAAPVRTAAVRRAPAYVAPSRPATAPTQTAAAPAAPRMSATRASGRRTILEQELNNERSALSQAQKALADGRAVSTNDENHQARVRQLESAVLDRQQNIQALQRELSRM